MQRLQLLRIQIACSQERHKTVTLRSQLHHLMVQAFRSSFFRLKYQSSNLIDMRSKIPPKVIGYRHFQWIQTENGLKWKRTTLFRNIIDPHEPEDVQNGNVFYTRPPVLHTFLRYQNAPKTSFALAGKKVVFMVRRKCILIEKKLFYDQVNGVYWLFKAAVSFAFVLPSFEFSQNGTYFSSTIVFLRLLYYKTGLQFCLFCL